MASPNKPKPVIRTANLAELAGTTNIFGGLYQDVLIYELRDRINRLDEPGILVIDCQNATGLLDVTAFVPAITVFRQREKKANIFVLINTEERHRKLLNAALKVNHASVVKGGMNNLGTLLMLMHSRKPRQWYLLGGDELNANQQSIWRLIVRMTQISLGDLANKMKMSLEMTQKECTPFIDNRVILDTRTHDGNLILYPVPGFFASL